MFSAKKQIPAQDFFLSFAPALVILAGSLFLAPVRYEAPDDFVIVFPFTSQDPNFQSVPITPWLNLLLRALYTHAPGVPWFGACIYIASLFGFALILGVLMRSCRGKAVFPALLLLLAAMIRCFCFASYTFSALILLLGVFLCLLEWAATGRRPVNNKIVSVLLLTACLLAAQALRWRMTLFAMPLAAPACFFMTRSKIRAASAAALPAILLFATVTASSYLSYSGTYYEHHLRRIKFADTIAGDYYGEVTEKALVAAGWSSNDWFIFRTHLLFHGDDLFSAQALEKFLQANTNEPLTEKLRHYTVRAFRRLKQDWEFLFLLCTSVALLFMNLTPSFIKAPGEFKKRAAPAMAAAAGAVILLLAVRHVERVYVPVYVYALGVFFVLLNHPKPDAEIKERRGKSRGVAVATIVGFALMVAVSCAYGAAMIKTLQQSKLRKDDLKLGLELIMEQRAEQPPVMFSLNLSDSFCFECINPLKERRDMPAFGDYLPFPSMWDVRSPRYYSLLKDLGLNSGRDLFEWMIDREDALILGFARQDMSHLLWKGLWEYYINEHIAPGRKIRLVQVHNFTGAGGPALKEGLTAYRLMSKERR